MPWALNAGMRLDEPGPGCLTGGRFVRYPKGFSPTASQLKTVEIDWGRRGVWPVIEPVDWSLRDRKIWGLAGDWGAVFGD